MKKKRISLVAIILAAAVVFSATGCSCGGVAEEKPEAFGTHIYTATDTEKDLVKNGMSDYKIVVPETPTDRITAASDELTTLFEEATGVKLPIVKCGDSVHDDEAKIISIDKTSQFLSSDIDADKKVLGKDGHKIVTKGNSIYLIGGTEDGSLYAVYTFLNIYFGFEAYYTDCYEMETGITDVKLKNFDVTDIPDIPRRINGYGILETNSGEGKYFKYRLRVPEARNNNFLPIFAEFGNKGSGAASSTNCDWYLPQDIYNNEETHPDTYRPGWFSDNCTEGRYQFCYTAHGDEASLEEMIDTCARKIEQSLGWYTPEEFPYMNVVTLTTQDNENKCTCSACSEELNKYGTDTGAVIKFMNRVMEKVVAWENEPENAAYKREELQLIFFAYQHLERAPVTYDSTTKKWNAIDSEVALRDDVGVYLAMIQNFDFQQEFNAEVNKTGRDILAAWFDMTSNIYLWLYETNYNNYMYMYDSFNFFNTETYSYLASKGVKYMTAQGQDVTPVSTVWSNLKIYIDAKLMWNSSLNTQTLTDAWFNAMFKEAAPAMKNLFEEIRSYTYLAYSSNGYLRTRSNSQAVAKASLWPIAVLDQWIAAFDAAKESLSLYYELNPKVYEKVYRHIELEAISPIYIELDLYGGFGGLLSEARKAELKNRLEKDILDLDLGGMLAKEPYQGSTTYISDVLKKD